MKIVVFPGPGRRAEPGPFAVLRARGAFAVLRARDAFGLAAALVGSVIGAGFLSGAELVRFFPAQGILPHAAVAAGLFFLCFWMLYRVGGACGGFAGVLARLGRAGPLLRAAMLASSFVLCAGMLAGLHSLAREGAGFGLSFPLPSLLALPLLYGLSGRGMRGLYAADALLVPLILLFVAANAGGALRSVQPAPAGAASSLAGVCLYVCMNAFLAAPVVCDAGAARGAGGGAAGCALAALLLGFCIAAVAGAVAGTGAADADLPFLAALGGGRAVRLLFCAVCACAILTSLFSAYYPLHRAAESARRPRLARAGICAAAFLLSAAGLSGLVRFVYPLVGGAGVVFFALLPRALFGRKRARAPAKPAAQGNSLAPAKPAARGGSRLPAKSAAPVSWRAPAKSAAPATPAARADRIPTGGGAGPPRAVRLFFDEDALGERDGGVHGGRQRAEDDGGGHHEV